MEGILLYAEYILVVWINIPGRMLIFDTDVTFSVKPAAVFNDAVPKRTDAFYEGSKLSTMIVYRLLSVSMFFVSKRKSKPIHPPSGVTSKAERMRNLFLQKCHLGTKRVTMSEVR